MGGGRLGWGMEMTTRGLRQIRESLRPRLAVGRRLVHVTEGAGPPGEAKDLKAGHEDNAAREGDLGHRWPCLRSLEGKGGTQAAKVRRTPV